MVFDAAEPAAAGGGTQRDLWLVRTDGTGLTRLTDTPADEEDPTVSPDGRRIAYAGDGDPSAGRQIYVRDLSGGGAARVTGSAGGTASEPAWNPVDDDVNRDWIAYTSPPPRRGGPCPGCGSRTGPPTSRCSGARGPAGAPTGRRGCPRGRPWCS
ncbi:hypothetical protein GCM10023238_12300 [Streptomyces heliomycini]